MTWRRTKKTWRGMKAEGRRRKEVKRGRGMIMIGRRMKMTWGRVEENLRGVEVGPVNGWRGQEVRRNEFKYLSLRNGQFRGWFWSRHHSSCISSHFNAWINSIRNLKRRTWYFHFIILAWRRTDRSTDCVGCLMTSTVTLELRSSIVKCFWFESKPTYSSSC